MSKPVIVSGAQPSGRLHIGNYVGAFLYRATERRPMVLPVIIEV